MHATALWPSLIAHRAATNCPRPVLMMMIGSVAAAAAAGR